MWSMYFRAQLPVSPKGQKRHRLARRGLVRMYDPSARDKKEIQQLLALAETARPHEDLPVKIVVIAFLPRLKKYSRIHHPWSLRKPDFDNIGKLVTDAANGILYDDDRKIADGRVIKAACNWRAEPSAAGITLRRTDAGEPRVEIYAWSWDDNDPGDTVLVRV